MTMSRRERLQPTHSITFFALSIASGESGPAREWHGLVVSFTISKHYVSW